MVAYTEPHSKGATVRFASIGSGSRGNALLIQNKSTCIMLDCGFSVRETERRMGELNLQPQDLSAIVITHEHADHVTGLGALARKFSIPVYATLGTCLAWKAGELPSINLINSHEIFSIGDLQFEPYPVPHDAKEPCQFVIGDGAKRIGILTDTGEITQHIRQKLDACEALVLECNHDIRMLSASNYPQSLKMRISGRLGHLSNDQAGQLLREIDVSNLSQLVAAHLSDKNNAADLARYELSSAMDCESSWIGIIDQQFGLQWRDI